MKRVLSLVLALVLVLGMIPTAFAADASGAQNLYDNGFITGKDGATVDAKLDVNAKLTRAQLAALIAELNGAKDEAAAFAQPADYTDAGTFQDWAKPFIAYAQQNEWMGGYPDGSFGANKEVPAQQLVAVLMNVLGYDVTWDTVLADAADLGIVAEGTALTRGEAFEAIWTAVSEVPMNTTEGLTLGVFLGKLEAPEVAALEVTATGAKKLTVKFGVAVDPAKAVLTVNKGTIAVNTDKVEFAADNKSAVITTTTQMTKGDYTVKATGIATDALTATVTVADVKVSAINITSDKAPRLADTGAGAKSALVRYEVLNQYGEQMTGQSITWTVSTGVAISNESNTTGAGTFEITAAGGADFIPGAVVYVTGVHAASATVVNAQVNIVTSSKADSVTFKGVYDTTKAVMVDNLPAGFANGRYELLYSVVDQYGFAVASPVFADLVFTSNNPLFVANTFANGGTATVSGVTYQAVELDPGSAVNNGGSVTIQAISIVTGKTSTFTTSADALAAVKSFTLSAPTSIVAEGETVEVPFTAVDQYGNAVTSYSKLSGAVTLSPAYAAGSGLQFVQKNDGSAKLTYTAPATGASASVDLPVYMTSIVTAGGNFSSLMVSVKDAAVPTAIIGLTTNRSVDIARVNTSNITIANLVIQDQYGRTMTTNAKNTWINASANNVIVVESTTGDAFTTDLNGGAASNTVILADDNDYVRVSAAAVPTVATENVKFSLATDGSTPIGASTKTLTFNNVPLSAYSSFEVVALGSMYNDATAASATAAAWNKTVVVKGVLPNGSKVTLPAASYTVSTSAGTKLDVTANVISDPAAGGYAAADFLDNTNAYKAVELTVLVTVNDPDTGAAVNILETPLVVSNKTPVVTTVTVESDNVTDGAAIVNPNVAALSAAYLTGSDFIYEVLDQYGVANANAPIITITELTRVSGSTFTVVANGTTTANVTGATMGDKFTLTLKYDATTVVIKMTVGLPQ